MKIGVGLALDRDAGELFADAKAFESAGADSLWVSGEDQAVVLAAIAAVTWRTRIVGIELDPGPVVGALAAVSRGRLVIAKRHDDELAVGEGETAERWIRMPFPAGREAWNELRTKSEAAAIDGIVLPNDPRLLDLIRNPEGDDDRSDLKLAFG